MQAVESKAAWHLRIIRGVFRVRRRVATGLAVILAVFFGFHVMFGRNGLNAYEAKRVEDKSLQKQIDSLRSENDRMKDHIDHLQTDPDAIEHEAREKLHYARPDEVIYTLNDAPNANDSAPAASPAAQTHR